MKNPQAYRVTSTIASLLLTTCFIINASWISWKLMSINDFFYPTFYHILNIDDTIQEFGPENRFKRFFGETDQQQHFDIFAKISKAVQHNTDDLKQISYHVPEKQYSDIFLRPIEIAHLEDVHHLIKLYEQTSLSTTILSLLLLLLFYKLLGIDAYRMRTSMLVHFAIIALFSLSLLIFGFEKKFYAFHEWIFPKDTPWFFYYQDSLMTTFMQAPNLFSLIGAAWFGLTIFIFSLLIILLNYFIKYFGSSSKR